MDEKTPPKETPPNESVNEREHGPAPEGESPPAPGGGPPPAAGGKQPRKLARSRDDRYIGGVAAGVGKYLGIDPILIRLAFVASIIFGGIGVLVYLVLLAALPIEGDPGVPLEPVEGKKRNLAIAGTVAVGILALISVGGSGFSAWIFGFGPGVVFGIFAWLAAAGLVALLLLAARGESGAGDSSSAGASPGAGSPTTAAGEPAAGPAAEGAAAAGGALAASGAPKAGSPSVAASKGSDGPAPTIAPSPSQTAPTGVLPRTGDETTAVMPAGPVNDAPSTFGKIMTWIAIGLSGLLMVCVLAVIAAGVTAVAGAVPMACVVILLGAGMIFAGIKGRQVAAIWLLVAALAVAVPMAAVSIADLRIDGSYGEVKENPTTAGDLPDDGYKLAAGELKIDLRRYPFRSGETLEIPISSGFGVTSVVVPDRVCVAGEFTGKAGLIDVRGTESSGVEIERSIGNPENGAPTLVLDADFKLGAIEVADSTEWSRHGGDPGNFGTFNYNDTQNRAVRERASAACGNGPGAGGESGRKPGGRSDGDALSSGGNGGSSGNGGSAG